jgi:hypothetical protein
VYGKEVAQIILDNSGLAYLKTNTMDTAEAISKRLGKKTIESNSISQSVSLTNYNGNKSTSLIARDLLTPDEVKNLHYKTIIFPNIGYPIFRDTVIYKKLSCYTSGEVERKVTPLVDLKDTYYTVEDIKTNYDNKIKSRIYSQKDKTDISDYEEVRKFESNKLQPIVEIVKNIVKEKLKLFEYKENNFRTYASFEISDKLSPKEKSLINARVNKEVFNIIINNGDETNSNTIIEIHLKSPLAFDETLEKGIKNNV